mmetsp:Transcript_7497/g.30467  ORF Transcript_7497/g.30467 Transcript_7497/m.30467 type:complete len:267 (-) Transcript_7497:1058-1858(-)
MYVSALRPFSCTTVWLCAAVPSTSIVDVGWLSTGALIRCRRWQCDHGRCRRYEGRKGRHDVEAADGVVVVRARAGERHDFAVAPVLAVHDKLALEHGRVEVRVVVSGDARPRGLLRREERLERRGADRAGERAAPARALRPRQERDSPFPVVPAAGHLDALDSSLFEVPRGRAEIHVEDRDDIEVCVGDQRIVHHRRLSIVRYVARLDLDHIILAWFNDTRDQQLRPFLISESLGIARRRGFECFDRRRGCLEHRRGCVGRRQRRV